MRKQLQALGRLKTGQMNKTESAYCQHLELRKHAGEMELHEVKGFWTDDARVKTKVAADQYPFRIIGVTAKAKKAGGGWNIEKF
ncbi:DUF1064 domain-containing protein [Salmonella enterica]|nr:DUF1064 domain-containing protein [Salmonella enterica]EAX4058949.1 DUF1064 domain-containing protein [Salmonella enterica]EDW9233207.1 DUF1064 domain-containing protein [Salmonella enterica]EEP0939540.1 DUF1064 domain-containing protein [Salmonella enterica]EEP0944844.1 DUF1064 domain-containing protein [Salmonella enterica]